MAFTEANHRRAVRVLDLDPIARRSRSVGRSKPLRNDALKPELAGVPEHGGAIPPVRSLWMMPTAARASSFAVWLCGRRKAEGAAIARAGGQPRKPQPNWSARLGSGNRSGPSSGRKVTEVPSTQLRKIHVIRCCASATKRSNSNCQRINRDFAETFEKDPDAQDETGSRHRHKRSGRRCRPRRPILLPDFRVSQHRRALPLTLIESGAGNRSLSYCLVRGVVCAVRLIGFGLGDFLLSQQQVRWFRRRRMLEDMTIRKLLPTNMTTCEGSRTSPQPFTLARRFGRVVQARNRAAATVRRGLSD
jgi:hypothetical protein